MGPTENTENHVKQPKRLTFIKNYAGENILPKPLHLFQTTNRNECFW